MAHECAGAVAAGLPHDNSWEEDDERLRFVYDAWMAAGAHDVERLRKSFKGADTPDTSEVPMTPTPLPRNPGVSSQKEKALGEARVREGSVGQVGGTRLGATRKPLAWEEEKGVSADAGGGAGEAIAKDGVPPTKAVPQVSAEKRRAAAEADEDEGTVGDIDEPEPINSSPLHVHRHVPFTLEKQKVVAKMGQDFLRQLHDYAKQENLDPTAVARVFETQLGGMKLSAWQAFQRLKSVARGGKSKPLCFIELILVLLTG